MMPNDGFAVRTQQPDVLVRWMSCAWKRKLPVVGIGRRVWLNAKIQFCRQNLCQISILQPSTLGTHVWAGVDSNCALARKSSQEFQLWVVWVDNLQRHVWTQLREPLEAVQNFGSQQRMTISLKKVETRKTTKCTIRFCVLCFCTFVFLFDTLISFYRRRITYQPCQSIYLLVSPMTYRNLWIKLICH